MFLVRDSSGKKSFVRLCKMLASVFAVAHTTRKVVIWHADDDKIQIISTFRCLFTKIEAHRRFKLAAGSIRHTVFPFVNKLTAYQHCQRYPSARYMTPTDRTYIPTPSPNLFRHNPTHKISISTNTKIHFQYLGECCTS